MKKKKKSVIEQTSVGCEWRWGLILVVAVLLAYVPAWQAGFIWDDTPLIVTNPCMAGFQGLEEIWTTHAADICPLTLTTFWMEHAVWGINPLPYHLINVLLHAVSAVLLWRVLLALRIPGAWLGAALWALHPVMVESVMSVSEMKNTQSAIFFLLSILLFVEWFRRGLDQGKPGTIWKYGYSLAFAALAMASKSSTVILPLVLCLCAWWLEGRWQWRNLFRTAPFFVLSVMAGLLSLWTQSVSLATDNEPQWARSWPQRIAGAGDAVWFYLGKLLWPHPLMAIYPRWQIDGSAWMSFLPLVGVLAAGVILWLNREGWARPWLFAYGYFLVALLPVLGLLDNFNFRYSLVFDHFQYLAAMGPLALAGAGLARLGEVALPQEQRMQRGLCAGLVLVLGLINSHQAGKYTSEETLWTDTLAKNPACWAGYNNLGMLALSKGNVDEAIGYFVQALDINSSLAQVRDNLGDALMKKGQVDDAMTEFMAVLQLDPNSAQAHYNLGDALVQKGRMDDAIAQYQAALAIDPNNPAAHNNLANALAQKGQNSGAMNEYLKALEGNSMNAEAQDNFGNVEVQAGHADDALAHYQKALEIDPTYVKAHYDLGNALAKLGRVDEAVAQYQKAIELNPDYADAHTNLGIVLAQQGRMSEAIAQFQAVVKLMPNDPNARANLARAQSQTQQPTAQAGH